MTSTFGTTSETNDIYLGPDGNLVVLVGLPAIIAACETATKAQLGEMILSINAGIPNFQTVWIGVPKLATYEAYLRRTLEGVEGVTRVAQLTLSHAADVLSYVAEIETPFGSGIVNG